MINKVVLVSGIIHAQPVCIVLMELKVNLVFDLLQKEHKKRQLFAPQEHSDLKLWLNLLMTVVNAQLAILALKCVLSRLFVHLVTTVPKPPLLCYLVLLALLALVLVLQRSLIAVPALEVDTVSKLLKLLLVVFATQCTIALRSQILQLHNIVTWAQQLTLLEKSSQSVINAPLEVTVVQALSFHYLVHQVNTIQIPVVKP
jgi:hypothetical protein